MQNDPGEYQPTPMPGMKPAWEVTKVEDVDTFNAQGPLKVKRVTVQLADGSTFTRDYPAASFDADKVKEDVDGHAAEVYSVLSLKSDTFV